jgi:hypothetical protein
VAFTFYRSLFLIIINNKPPPLRGAGHADMEKRSRFLPAADVTTAASLWGYGPF